jgi:hypothetical protein
MNVSTLYKILNIQILVYSIQESNGNIKFRATTRYFNSTSWNGELSKTYTISLNHNLSNPYQRIVSEIKMLTFPSNASTTARALFARALGKLLDCKKKYFKSFYVLLTKEDRLQI